VAESLDQAFLSEAKRWIAFDTVTTRSNARFAAYLQKRFAALGFATRLQKETWKGSAFYNVLARRGPFGQKPLLLNTHLDTVPPGPHERWTATNGRPWRAVLRRGRLYGLGVADVKLNLLCQWEALRQIGPEAFRRPLCVAGTFGEERGLRGAQRLMSRWRGPKPALALVGEPSQLRPVRRHRGYLVFEWSLPLFAAVTGQKTPAFRIRVPGRSAHSSTPHLGVNAIEKALAFLGRLERRGPVPWVASLSGGTAANQVPAEAVMDVVFPGPLKVFGPVQAEAASLAAGAVPVLPWRILAEGLRRLMSRFNVRRARPGRSPVESFSCNAGLVRTGARDLQATFDVRFPPGTRSETVIAEVTAILQAVCAPLRLRLRVERNNPALNARPGGPARFVRQALKASGLPRRWADKATCTEAGIYDRAGVPAVVLGPGRSEGNIHRPNEFVDAADLQRAVRFYRNLITLWCLR
jgi:acetylornithine deacetylase/succinyl-diaminopimelate desuccinylase-like protein